ncbi:hypothetical protein PG997_009383 [Apiospora hydei]|uniref:Uncharacterized protein n=1 Tax=Apiospora hydei TaxID=1337664 RepID=A0ABR1VX53_9PEZI
MAPIRRYLRITKYSVIECRIYLDNPALAQTWLLNPRKPVLPRVIESVRPLVLPKLREERERSRNKRSTKKKAIKDLVVEDDFEVSIFLTETTTRHSLVTKHKHFHDTTQTKLTSNSGRLVGATHEAPLDVDMHAASGVITILREESDDEDLQPDAVPLAPASVTVARPRPRRLASDPSGRGETRQMRKPRMMSSSSSSRGATATLRLFPHRMRTGMMHTTKGAGAISYQWPAPCQATQGGCRGR